MSDWLNITAPSTGAALVGGLAGAAGAPASATGGSFRVTRDQAPALKAKFQEAIDKLERARKKVRNVRVIEPPAADRSSEKLAEALHDKAVGESGSALRAIESAIEAYQSVVDQLDKAMGTYQQSDENHGFKG
ncbi:hypothetical protein LX15_006402 [Streptoalloteichus tenebrarius]|uniref:PE domain-containing protein n=1 Tax=Streptoalloteichus tenebrarius (strain ATCC 17920 / DSM 40477 / JCM 4838 / CBS 697.72 / NBRC 16177 / NCIMB 11028 / NRRL B-12390 / A12253. 1 / ISP 5477) TaxID=1933 RepID=A0ABT1I4I8_STRSD|nr:hypothetical protein [Streptoalloteichus tenebrarius]MCP2262660.1 hypothetical protein [Streptoalloteichus tenebrarius]BFF02102.1 hypothetical protein GCM10020241_37770 [Streptoalloteichus tenebrarius]